MDRVGNVIALAEHRPTATALVTESNHRIANQLSILASTIELQIAAIGKGPELMPRGIARSALREVQVKIVSVAHLHRRLASLAPESTIDLGNLLLESANEIVAALSLSEHVHVRQKLSGECLVSAEQASALVQMLSEIVMNAIKYAHPTHVPVQIDIDCERMNDGSALLEISDDGVGLPENFDEARQSGLGLRLIRALARRIGATLRIETSDLGLNFRVELPPPRMADAVQTLAPA